jgi:hypothetical protein
MASDGTYTNVQTSDFSDGENRGQVFLVAATGEVESGQGNGDNQQGN